MKRKYKHVEQILDEALLTAINGGESRNQHLKQVIHSTLTHHLLTTGEITVAYLLDALCGTELSAAKQRLQAGGMIEINGPQRGVTEVR